eukprot:1887471-Amphidinium_carterae.1
MANVEQLAQQLNALKQAQTRERFPSRVDTKGMSKPAPFSGKERGAVDAADQVDDNLKKSGQLYIALQQHASKEAFHVLRNALVGAGLDSYRKGDAVFSDAATQAHPRRWSCFAPSRTQVFP